MSQTPALYIYDRILLWIDVNMKLKYILGSEVFQICNIVGLPVDQSLWLPRGGGYVKVIAIFFIFSPFYFMMSPKQHI